MDPLADLALPGLIHDLNNVFQTLMDAADSLAGDQRWEPLSAAIFRSIERGREITQSMQAIDQPSAPFETVLRNARNLVEDSMTLRHGPQIRFVAQVEPAIVLRNAWAWERVLINLFCNAVQASTKIVPPCGMACTALQNRLIRTRSHAHAFRSTIAGSTWATNRICGPWRSVIESSTSVCAFRNTVSNGADG